MRDFVSDSSEELYSLSTQTTNIFDFTTADTFISSEALSLDITQGRLRRLFLGLINLVKTTIFTFLKTFFEFSMFLAYGLTYAKSKFAALVNFFDISKDKIVQTLMWRRGLLFRPATHGGVVVLAGLAIVAGGLFTRGQIAAQDLTLSEAVLKSTNTAKTIVPTDRPRSDVVSYKVASGDSLSTLSSKFNVSIESIKWANNMTDSDTINPNQNLNIPPVTGVVYKVKASDTLDSIAKAFSADKQTIVDFPFNYIDDSLSLKVGQTLFVPNGSIPAPVKKPTVFASRPSTFVVGSGMLSWPVPARISQYYSWYHTGIDLANPYGTPIYAAANGVIVDAKKQTYSFGWYCEEDLGNGYHVWYAHMSAQACYVGQTVTRGQYLGAVGATGRATGPHLHLEVHYNGKAVDPMSLLK